MDVREVVPSASELRSQAQHFMEIAKFEADPQIKRGFLSCAFAISQLAERIEVRSGVHRP